MPDRSRTKRPRDLNQLAKSIGDEAAGRAYQPAMEDLKWPDRWQQEAIQAALPYVDTDERLDILVDDPATAVAGTRIGGHLYRGADGTLMMIHDRSGRPGIFPWRLLMGPVLVIKLLRPRRRSLELYRHPDWTK